MHDALSMSAISVTCQDGTPVPRVGADAAATKPVGASGSGARAAAPSVSRSGSTIDTAPNHANTLAVALRSYDEVAYTVVRQLLDIDEEEFAAALLKVCVCVCAGVACMEGL